MEICYGGHSAQVESKEAAKDGLWVAGLDSGLVTSRLDGQLECCMSIKIDQ